VSYPLSLLLLLTACSPAVRDDSDTSKPIDTGKPPPDEACLETLYAKTVSASVSGLCVKCHISDGLADESALLFVTPGSVSSAEIVHENFQTLWRYTRDQQVETLKIKPFGGDEHGGGSPLDSASESGQAFVIFVETMNGERSCDTPPIPTLNDADFTLLDSWQTARAVSLILGNTLPTEEEWAALTEDIHSIDPILDRLFADPVFNRRISQIYEDTLLTATHRSRNNSLWLQRSWGFAPDSQGMTPGQYRWADLYWEKYSDPWNQALESTAFGFSRSPQKLVEYILKNNLDFGEILTAEYTMMNAHSARAYGHEDDFPTPWEPGGEDPPDEGVFHPVVLTEVPTAGLLTDINFLATYPTDAVNLNRNRSREVLDHFLATDILQTTARTALELGEHEDNPTYNNAKCTYCHFVMDPIAGTFQNWPRIQVQGIYDPLHPDAQARWEDTAEETVLQRPGYDRSTPLPESWVDGGVRWLAHQIVEDPRFAIATTDTLFEGLTGRPPLLEPIPDHPDYVHLHAIWVYQRALLDALAEGFINEQRDYKELVRQMIKSPLIRATDTRVENPLALRHLGLNKLTDPEDLQRRLEALTGRGWHNYFSRTEEGDANYHWNNDIDRPQSDLLVGFRESCGNGGNGCYARWYALLGGIDVNPSGGSDTRLRDPNVIITGVHRRMTVEVSNRLVARDFSIISRDSEGLFKRRFFPFVDIDTVPEDDNGVNLPENTDAIIENIRFLHRLLWGEDFSADHEEVQNTYNLWTQVWDARPEKKGLGFSEKVEQAEIDYKAQWDAEHGQEVLERREMLRDDTYVIRSWRVVLDYLLSDPSVLYELPPLETP